MGEKGKKARSVTLVLLIVGILLALRPLYIAGVEFAFWQPISRPYEVSKTARYVSLIEAATWFDCSIDHKLDVNWCTAWDATGRLVAKGAFQLEGEHRAANESELYPSLVEASQGKVHAIYLFRSQSLLHGGVDAFSRKLAPISVAGESPN